MLHVIAAVASEPEGSSLIDRRLLFGACNHFFLLNARNCGYGQMKDLGCAVVMAQGIVVMREWKIKDVQWKMRDWTI